MSIIWEKTNDGIWKLELEEEEEEEEDNDEEEGGPNWIRWVLLFRAIC